MDVVRAGISAFLCDAGTENLLLVREMVREMVSLGGRRLLPPTPALDGSSLPATNGLTDRSSFFERSENIEEVEPALCLPSSDESKGLNPAVAAACEGVVDGSRLSGRMLGSRSSLSCHSITV